jgi:plastocyanin
MATCRLLLCAVACKQGKYRHPCQVLNVSTYHDEGLLRRVVQVRRLLTILTLFAIAATLAAGAVRIADFAFAPDSLRAEVGQSVRWTNQDGAAHTVTADDGAFDSGSLAGGKEFSFAFDRAGTYAYHCNIHPGMKGTVTVAA